jgi:Beta-propeller repeat/Dockerin type I domain
VSSSGTSLIFSTYLGGEIGEWGYGIAVDDSGNAYVTGSTGSSDFPTQNPYQVHQGSNDVFVTKLSGTTGSLVYSTYLGGQGPDWGFGITVDGSGNAYVTGTTWSSNFPTSNPYQTYQGGGDVFVTKVSSSGASLIYSSYFGGGDIDYGQSIAADGSGYVYVTGYTGSSNFPTQNPYSGTGYGSYDAFVTKLREIGYLCGDADGERSVNIADAVFIVEYIFSGGATPNPLAAGDANCSGDINVSDVVYLVAYIFSYGPQPCAGCK